MLLGVSKSNVVLKESYVSAMHRVAADIDLAALVKRQMEATETLRFGDELSKIAILEEDIKTFLSDTCMTGSAEEMAYVKQVEGELRLDGYIKGARAGIKHCERMMAIQSIWRGVAASAHGDQKE
jgi:hypothetical protein